MKTYTAAEAIELAKKNPGNSYFFENKNGDLWPCIKLLTVGPKTSKNYEPYIPHRLVPIDDDQISERAAHALKEKLNADLWTGEFSEHIDDVYRVIDQMTRKE